MPRWVPKVLKKDKKHAWWRPTKKNEETVKKLEEIFKIDWTVSEACSNAWISRETYYNRESKDKEFFDRMTRAKNFMYILARRTWVKWLNDWDTKSAIEYLKRRDKRYKDKQETTIEVSISEEELEDEE